MCLFVCFLAGGAVLEDGDGTDLAQVYNPKTYMWTEVAPMQIARSGSAACTLKGKIYVIGITVSTLAHFCFKDVRNQQMSFLLSNLFVCSQVGGTP